MIRSLHNEIFAPFAMAGAVLGGFIGADKWSSEGLTRGKEYGERISKKHHLPSIIVHPFALLGLMGGSLGGAAAGMGIGGLAGYLTVPFAASGALYGITAVAAIRFKVTRPKYTGVELKVETDSNHNTPDSRSPKK
ncbi:MAG: hypothetical protein KGI80_05155 [Verrucomicrobiota bacterium]|nr:hypothetical protein [Verrucomicrobiota bacterium]